MSEDETPQFTDAEEAFIAASIEMIAISVESRDLERRFEEVAERVTKCGTALHNEGADQRETIRHIHELTIEAAHRTGYVVGDGVIDALNAAYNETVELLDAIDRVEQFSGDPQDAIDLYELS